MLLARRLRPLPLQPLLQPRVAAPCRGYGRSTFWSYNVRRRQAPTLRLPAARRRCCSRGSSGRCASAGKPSCSQTVRRMRRKRSPCVSTPAIQRAYLPVGRSVCRSIFSSACRLLRLPGVLVFWCAFVVGVGGWVSVVCASFFPPAASSRWEMAVEGLRAREGGV